ncbi:MAG: hypothetical protein CMH54_09855 [Myxococcales bacterium]|nr:hypothetical protein [Myxococcales bacterium]
MNDFLNQTYGQNSVRDMLIAIAIVLAGGLISVLLRRNLRRIFVPAFTRMGFPNDIPFVRTISNPISAGLTVGFIFGASRVLVLPPDMRSLINSSLYIIAILLSLVLCMRLIDAFFTYWLEPLTKKTRSQLDDQLVVFGRKFAKIAVIMLLVLATLDQLGMEVSTLVAGLGLGGLAIALAAKETVGNILGSLQIMADNPFTIGDMIRVGDHLGYVQDIGLRSTKILTRSGVRVIIPNRIIAESPIENVSVGSNIAVDMEIGLIYGTTAEQIDQARDVVREILKEHPGVCRGELVQFLKFGESSLVLQVTYFVDDLPHYWEVQHQINMEVKRKFEALGLNFAFPTRTVHMASD